MQYMLARNPSSTHYGSVDVWCQARSDRTRIHRALTAGGRCREAAFLFCQWGLQTLSQVTSVVLCCGLQELEQEMSEETALERDAAQKEEKAHRMEDELRRLEQQHERDVKEYRSAAAR